MKPTSITEFNDALSADDKAICDVLRSIIDGALHGAESKVWHAHPVWFLDGNPIVGYSKMKNCIRLMFWSGADFDEPNLKPGSGKFKDASIRYTTIAEIKLENLRRWLKKGQDIQWDYKNIYKRKGRLERLI